ncbi:hyaluronidase-2 [Denticeps clupeoides]|uniref:Hyaluronidase n=1 Tax=Denticeps clupeoides TaxID=299321 RepID=A0AAY4E430_9TELE|nr:hyaluronidase-2-like [Denticeps clupeoides]XP_028855137.1 hyaluronidase-2-like [Denticeps clupeoides]
MARWPANKWRVCLLLLSLVWPSFASPGDPKPTKWPLYPHKPLLLAWNAPTKDCDTRHGVHLQLEQFLLMASPNENPKPHLTVFHKDLGLYPHIARDGTLVNNGLPQSVSLSRHLEEVLERVKRYIQPNAMGLAIIDWEEWRPLWSRNWDTKDVYRNQSRELVAQKNPTWPQNQVSKVAHQEFELSGRKLMLETLRLAKSLRPEQLWGFYLFPDCYNHNYRNSLENYTGRCPDVEVARNEQLRWLWLESSALFPSIYLDPVLRSTPFARLYTRNRVKEGMRLASAGEGLARPVFVCASPTYTKELQVLSEDDLVATIGESVALGAAGVILWGDDSYAASRESCASMNQYVSGPLGRYLLNVTTAAEHCSRALCGSNGRCLRRRADADAYLHLSPLARRIAADRAGRLRVEAVGEGARDGDEDWAQDFRCQCFSGFLGDGCAQSDPAHQRGAAPTLGAWRAWPTLPLLLVAVTVSRGHLVK